MIVYSNSLTLQGGRAPNHDVGRVVSTSGYHGLPCMRVGGVGLRCLAQHPVQPHRQFTSDGHLGHRFTTTEHQPLVVPPQFHIGSRSRLRRLQQQKAHQRIALLC